MKQNILLLHGGPGMNSDYFSPWFDPLMRDYNLVFYDQSGNMLDALHTQLADHVKANNTPHIIAHSWGAFLILSALKQGIVKACDMASLILIAPKMLSDERAQQSIARLKSKIPHDVSARLDVLRAQEYSAENAREFMRLITPYYHHDQGFNMGASGFFDRRIALAIGEEIGGYDLRPIDEFLPKRSMCIYGASDFIEPEPEYKDTLGEDNIHILKNAGHYVFAERQSEVIKLIKACLGKD